MALMECSECGKQISDKAIQCPDCGAPLDSVEEPNAEQVPEQKSGCGHFLYFRFLEAVLPKKLLLSILSVLSIFDKKESPKLNVLSRVFLMLFALLALLVFMFILGRLLTPWWNAFFP